MEPHPFGCHESSEFFIGKWQILSIVENNKNFELKENWIQLKSNGTFTSYDGELNKTESGFWKHDNKTNDLLIDDEEDAGDSSWNLEMRNDSLIFKSTIDSTYLISTRLRE